MKHISTLGFSLFCVLLFLSCEPDEEDFSQVIQGTWFQESGMAEDTALSYRNELIFRADGTYERSLQMVETKAPQNTVGYLSLETGEYEAIGNQLNRFNIELYGLDNVNPYLDRENLVFVSATDKLPAVGLLINDGGDQLTLDYLMNSTCPDFAMCVESETFYRDN